MLMTSLSIDDNGEVTDNTDALRDWIEAFDGSLRSALKYFDWSPNWSEDESEAVRVLWHSAQHAFKHDENIDRRPLMFWLSPDTSYRPVGGADAASETVVVNSVPRILSEKPVEQDDL
jgi:hypothetical protein